ncbi:hypothetical protein K788_00028340 [Paraburkholderia caribensis MBA4]|uniref:Uncharacterized protein n=1 Tax=Paraburkholderia caribensis MBA4 TaxID=1323664 RepID=A0A0N7JUA6_9BURK|nr:hypothetical protein K788_00028340 [Paraburkholderia caribensis MBA4]
MFVRSRVDMLSTRDVFICVSRFLGTLSFPHRFPLRAMLHGAAYRAHGLLICKA